MHLILAEMLWAETVRWTMEVLRRILYGVDVGTDGALGVVTTLELVQHQLSESGHSSLLVTQTLHGRKRWGIWQQIVPIVPFLPVMPARK
jgi:hypothetical protein